MPLRPGAEFRPLRPAVRWIHGGHQDSEHPRGKPELVHFFSLSCADCEPQLKRIAELAHELGDEVKIVGVHTPVEVRDMDPEHVREEVDRLGLDYAVALDGDDGAAWPYDMGERKRQGADIGADVEDACAGRGELCKELGFALRIFAVTIE